MPPVVIGRSPACRIRTHTVIQADAVIDSLRETIARGRIRN